MDLCVWCGHGDSGSTLDADHGLQFCHLAREARRVRGIDHGVDILVSTRCLFGHAA